MTVSPEERKRLQQLFAKGSQVAAKGDFDYATTMFQTCIEKDPANRLYAENFVGNLQKKYGNNKSGVMMAGFKSAGSKTMLEKAQLSKDWLGVIKSGMEILKLNPWDVNALVKMAYACEKLQYDETEVFYYEKALDKDGKDYEVNKKLGAAYHRLKEFDKALVCYQRAHQAKPADHEIPRIISNISVEKSIAKNKMEEAQTTQDIKVKMEGGEGRRLSVEEELEKSLAKDPSQVGKWLELADRYRVAERYAEADSALNRAFEVSKGDLNVVERLEDVKITTRRDQVESARIKAQEENHPARTEEHKQLKKTLLEEEVVYYRSRVERYPQNLEYRYALAERLQEKGDFKEAIESFQKAKADTQKRGRVLLELGICFYNIRQVPLAMNHFKEAVDAIPDTDDEQKKRALYLTGKLALLVVKDYAAAKTYLNRLASMDFSYKDVSDLLEKLANADS